MVPEHPPEGFVYFIGRVLAQDELFHFVVAVQPVGRGEVNKAGKCPRSAARFLKVINNFKYLEDFEG